MSKQQNIKSQVEAILADGNRIRQGISELLLSVIKETGFQAGQVKNSVGEVMEGLGSYLKDQGDQVTEDVVEEVIEGVGDAVESGLNATSLAFDEAKASGKEFAKDEITKLQSDFTGLRDIVWDVVMKRAESIQSISKDTVSRIDTHLGRTIERVEPSVERTLEVLKNHPLELTAGVAGSVFSAIGSAIQGFGDELLKKKSESDKKPE